MKRILFFTTALVLLATGCNKGQKFTLTGDLMESRFDSKTDSLFLQSEALATPAVIHVTDGMFSYTGNVEKPAYATLRGGSILTTTQHLILEKGTITFKNGLPCGTPLNDAAYDLSHELRKLAHDQFGDRKANAEKAVQLVREYLAEHGDDPTAIVALQAVRRFVSAETMAELIGMTSKEIQNEGAIRTYSKQINRVKKLSETKPE